MEATLILEAHPRNPRARVRVLIGRDDGHEFRVVVPLRIRSVQDALDWLRPEGVPEDALRQGEFYFVPSDGPHEEAGCRHGDDPQEPRWGCGGHESTHGGSSYEWSVSRGSFSATHVAEGCLAVTKSGDVMFFGRRRMKSHRFVARPQYFARGYVHHAEHGTLHLPAHKQGAWYEVIPNRAHGSFPVRGYGRGD